MLKNIQEVENQILSEQLNCLNEEIDFINLLEETSTKKRKDYSDTQKDRTTIHMKGDKKKKVTQPKNKKSFLNKLKQFFVKLIKAVMNAFNKFSKKYVEFTNKIIRYNKSARALVQRLGKNKKRVDAELVASHLAIQKRVYPLTKPDNYKKIIDLPKYVLKDEFNEKYDKVKNLISDSFEKEEVYVQSLANADKILAEAEDLTRLSKDAAKKTKNLKNETEKNSKNGIKEVKAMEASDDYKQDRILYHKMTSTNANKLFNLFRQASLNFLFQNIHMSQQIIAVLTQVPFYKQMIEAEKAKKDRQRDYYYNKYKKETETKTKSKDDE